MNKTKFLALLTILCLIFSALSGCSGNTQQAQDSSAAPSNTDVPRNTTIPDEAPQSEPSVTTAQTEEPVTDYEDVPYDITADLVEKPYAFMENYFFVYDGMKYSIGEVPDKLVSKGFAVSDAKYELKPNIAFPSEVKRDGSFVARVGVQNTFDENTILQFCAIQSFTIWSDTYNPLNASDGNVSIVNGIKLGDSVADVEKAFGPCDTILPDGTDGLIYLYLLDDTTENKSNFEFGFRNGVLIKISASWDFLN